MKLIVGLGNPGKGYEKTRHNIGFLTVDYIVDSLNLSYNAGFNGLYIKTQLMDEDVIFFKPLKFMNLSGEAIKEIVNYYKIEINDILIIYDDVDLAFAKLRLRESGSSGGHNGIRNIIAHLKSEHFKRIRIGIGKDEKINTADYVLSKFKKDELVELEHIFVLCKQIVFDFTSIPFQKIMSKVNK